MMSAAALAAPQQWVTDDCTGPRENDCWLFSLENLSTPFQPFFQQESDLTGDVGYGALRIYGVRRLEEEPSALLLYNFFPDPNRAEGAEILSDSTYLIGPTRYIFENLTPVDLVVGGPGYGLENIVRYGPGSVPGVVISTPSPHHSRIPYGWSMKGVQPNLNWLPRTIQGTANAPSLAPSRLPQNVLAPPEVLLDPPALVQAHPARTAAQELREWLDITYVELGDATDIGETTFHYWKRAHATPRPATTRQLFRLHAFVSALRRVLGHRGATEWFRAGNPAPLDLLRAGRFGEIEALAARSVFSGTVGSPEYSKEYIEDAEGSYVAKAGRVRPLGPLKPTRRTRMRPNDR